MDEPRAYTKEEVQKMILGHCRAVARYWANLPDVDPHTGIKQSVEDRCNGVAFSILVMIDGCSMEIPALDLTLCPHPDDKSYDQKKGSNWFEEDMVINDNAMLHEMYYKG